MCVREREYNKCVGCRCREAAAVKAPQGALCGCVMSVQVCVHAGRCSSMLSLCICVPTCSSVSLQTLQNVCNPVLSVHVCVCVCVCESVSFSACNRSRQ